MVTRVVSVPAGAAPGRTVTVDGRAYLVLHLLPSIEGRALAARVARDPPCRLCEAPMVWRPGGWCCSVLAETLADWCRRLEAGP